MGRINYVTIRGSKLSFGYPQNELCENLNADMVDNYHASEIPKPKTLVVTRSDGKIDPSFLPSGIGGDIKVVIDRLDYHKYVKLNDLIYITPQAHTDQEEASIDYYQWILPDDSQTTTPSSNPTLAYQAPDSETELTFYVTAVDTYGNQSVTKTITINVVQELPPVINDISWNMTDFYENKSYVMTIDAESYENKPLSYQVTCDDPSVTIENYQDYQNKFLITFPELSQEKAYNLNIVVSDGDKQTEETEQCVAKPMLDFVYRFEDILACSNIVTDSQGYLYIAYMPNISSEDKSYITFEKMDKGLVTLERKTIEIDLSVDISSFHNVLSLTIYNDKLYVLIPTVTNFYVIEINSNDLSLSRTSVGFSINISSSRIASPCSLLRVNNLWFIGCFARISGIQKVRLFKVNLDTLRCEKLYYFDGSSSTWVKDCVAGLTYDPTQDRILYELSMGLGTGNQRNYIYPLNLDLVPAGKYYRTEWLSSGKYNDQSLCIIEDKIYQIVHESDKLRFIKIDLNQFPDISGIEYSGHTNQLGLGTFTSSVKGVKLLPINSSEMLLLLNTSSGTRGGWGCVLMKIDKNCNLLGSLKVDSINDDQCLFTNSEILISDNYVYMPIRTSISYPNKTISIVKISLDTITNEEQSFCLDSFPFYLDSGIIPPLELTDKNYYEERTGGNNVTSDIQHSDVPLSGRSFSYTPETHKDPFI